MNLIDIELFEVSLVDKGANQLADIVLFKRDGDTNMPVKKKEQKEPDVIDKAMPAPEVTDTEPMDEGEEESTVVVVEDGCGDKNSDMKKRDDELENLRKRNSEFEVELKKLRMEKAESEWINKASSVKFADKNSTGALLNKISVFDQELASDVLTLLLSADAQISAGNLFVEVGKGIDAKISAFDKLSKIADEIRKAQNVTQAKAFSSACELNPELVIEYRQAK